MVYRIGIATEDEKGLDDVVAERFARAPKLTIITIDEKGEIKDIKVIDNPGAAATSGAAVKTLQVLIDEGVDVVIGPAFGPNAQAIIAEMNMKSLQLPKGTPVREAVNEAKKLLGIQ